MKRCMRSCISVCFGCALAGVPASSELPFCAEEANPLQAEAHGTLAAQRAGTQPVGLCFSALLLSALPLVHLPRISLTCSSFMGRHFNALCGILFSILPSHSLRPFIPLSPLAAAALRLSRAARPSWSTRRRPPHTCLSSSRQAPARSRGECAAGLTCCQPMS